MGRAQQAELMSVKADPRVGGIARYTVRDEDGLQAWPRPGTHATMIACQRFIERYGDVGKAAAMREP